MFFNIVRETNVHLHPCCIGPNLQDNVVLLLKRNVEGSCCPALGFIVAITNIECIGRGILRTDGTGYMTFPVRYQCVVLKPFNGEILQAVVTRVNSMGIFGQVGPIEVFVSAHLMPEYMTFQSGDVPKYAAEDGSFMIQINSEVRMSIIATRIDAGVLCWQYER